MVMKVYYLYTESMTKVQKVYYQVTQDFKKDSLDSQYIMNSYQYTDYTTTINNHIPHPSTTNTHRQQRQQLGQHRSNSSS